MKVTVMRIDERLIHGQIVTAWIAEAEAKSIIVADDKASKDQMQKMLLEMATPPGVTLKILSLKDASIFINEDMTEDKTLLIVRGPVEANQLLEMGITIDKINVGNICMKKGKKKILSAIWLDDIEAEALKALSGKGIKLDVRAVPTDRSQDAMELIRKHY